MGTTSSPPASSATSNRLTGRTASQVQGASRVSSQMRMNDVVSESCNIQNIYVLIIVLFVKLFLACCSTAATAFNWTSFSKRTRNHASIPAATAVTASQ